MFTPEMYKAMISQIMDHAASHLSEAREALDAYASHETPLEDRLEAARQLRVHLLVVRGDMARAVFAMGEDLEGGDSGMNQSDLTR